MRELFALLACAAASEATVLLEGETGTGKELLAEGVHRASHRAAAPFVVPPLGSLSVSREFDFAFAPHAPLEVSTCVADVRTDSAEIWYGAKSPIVAAQKVAAAVGLP